MLGPPRGLEQARFYKRQRKLQGQTESIPKARESRRGTHHQATPAIRGTSITGKLGSCTIIRHTDLILAKIENHTLNRQLLAADDPLLAQALTLISEGPGFEKLFVDDCEAPQTRALSRGMLKYAHDLQTSGVIEATGNEGKAFMNAFLTEKKNGEGRLSWIAAPVNRMQKKPPKMNLPKIQDIVQEFSAGNMPRSATANHTSISFNSLQMFEIISRCA